MPRVRQAPPHESPQPVQVIGQIFGADAGQVVIVSLVRQCSWHGQLVPMRLETRTTAGGHFALALPPTSELATVDGQPVPLYLLQAPGVHRVPFVVPDGKPEWRLEL